MNTLRGPSRILALTLTAIVCLHQRPTASSLDRDHVTGLTQHVLWGRLSKVPVSAFFRHDLRAQPGQELSFEAQCVSPQPGGTNRPPCDTGMLVWLRDGARAWSLFNNDAPENIPGVPRNNLGSQVTTGTLRRATDVSVFVFSMYRSTSTTDIRMNRGRGWETLALSLEIGGTLVDVGPLQPNDTITVETASNGAHFDNTQMLLFRTDGGAAPLFSRDVALNDPIEGVFGDADPRVTVTDASWVDGVRAVNVALIGQERRSSGSNRGVETHVDVVHLPLDAAEDVADLNAVLALSAGRWLISIEAGTDSPVGSYGSTAFPKSRPASDMNEANGAIFPIDGGPLGTRGIPWTSRFKRGAPNGEALTVAVQDVTGQRELVRRSIPRGAFGSNSSVARNRFVFEVALDRPRNIRVVVLDRAADVSVAPRWMARRNPDSSELKVASYNILYESDDEDAKFRNASNLLATRGTILRGELRVEERLDQAPWQWDADVIGLQEVRRRCTADCEPSDFVFGGPWKKNGLADVFRDEAHARGSVRWQYAFGRDESWFLGLGAGPGLGALYVNERHWPRSNDSNSMFFGETAKRAGGCKTDVPLPYAECHLPGGGRIRNYAVMAKAAVQPTPTVSGIPIAVFNLHLEANGDELSAVARESEIQRLMETIDRLLAVEPLAFNPAGNRDPRSRGNRILLVGDFNMQAHSRGEHYWILRQLRERYGYAVDVALTARSGMHDQGEYDRDGVPVGYTSIWTWRQRCNSSPTCTVANVARFPWWNSTSRGDDSQPEDGERMDGVILVGLGWSLDDPVVAYAVMSDRTDVKMWPWPNGSWIRNPQQNYAPNRELSPGQGLYPGAPALRSDHRPVGARLRIMTR